MSDAKNLSVERADYQLSGLFFSRVWRLIKPFWQSRANMRWWFVGGVLLATTPVLSIIFYHVTMLTADMTNALVAKNRDEYTKLFWVVTAAGAALWLTTSILFYFSNRLNVRWREWLTNWIVERYLKNRTYYDISLKEDLDNPDQRIQEDIGPFVSALSLIPQKMISQVFSLVTGGFIIASISSAMMGYVVVYAIISTLVMLAIYTPLIRLNFISTVAEADLRYGLLHVRDNSETIGFYRGEAAEYDQISSRLKVAVRSDLDVLNYNLKVSAVNYGMGQIWSLAPFFLIAPLFFEDKIEYGAIAMATTAAAQMLYALTVLSQTIPDFAKMAPNAVRLAQIIERFNALDDERKNLALDTIKIFQADEIYIRALSLMTPGGEQHLVENLNLSVPPGHNLVICGPTGVGKSSLLRAMAGLWDRGTGDIGMPVKERCFFLPQKPYMILGSLREQLLYPRKGAALIIEQSHVTDEEIAAALTKVCLPKLIKKSGGLSSVRDWGKVLSLGEQQRIAFARVLINKPQYLFLDESTSAVDVLTEEVLYSLMSEIGATYISVGHRPSIIRFHNSMLELDQYGGWAINPL
ncbi:ABC transporter ATP-binding protein/permease [Pseudomonas lactucae]|uniref:ABC transporter ATP-binding protein/permease n=1 Tax=Pseudomonas lactucae TaxID=2813360 RepID=UPI002FCD0D24